MMTVDRMTGERVRAGAWCAVGVALTVSALGVGLAACATAEGERGGPAADIAALSARSDMVTGGDVLLRINAADGAAVSDLQVTLNNADVTAEFRSEPGGEGLVGLVIGLSAGANTLAVLDGEGADPIAQLTLENHPVTGPVFSGPHEVPFVCESAAFELVSGETLGEALDADCSVDQRVDYAYRSTDGDALKPLADPGQRPADVAKTTTLTGREVPYIVRIETGTVNRAIYQIAMLHDPQTAETPDPWTRSAGWNGRLIYTFGGGCTAGWYRQGSRTGGVDDDVMLRQGYAVASATLNVFGNNCNDLLAAETMMMVKERFIETYGVPMYTIGWGCSGGSYQNHQIADNYPGLLDGIIPGCSFPDVVSGTIPAITDARLLNHYFKERASIPFTDEQQRAVAGFLTLATMPNVSNSAGRIAPTEFCPQALPEAMRYDPVDNPKGARCDVYDHTVNIYGRDPRTGFARRPLDNVGVQYGLKALNDGAISTAQFLDLNERIGGYDADARIVADRTVADPEALRAAYETGRVTSGGGGLSSIPIIDYRAYSDDAQRGDVHLRYHSFSMRERLLKANGRADNHVMLVEDFRHGFYSTESPVAREALRQMDRWLENLARDTSTDPAIEKVARAKPGDLVDACWSRDERPQKIAEPQVRGQGRCEASFSSAPPPREVAGAPLASDILKCQLKPIDPSDYRVSFTARETDRLRTIFPAGVCDWSKPGVGQTALKGTWLRF